METPNAWHSTDEDSAQMTALGKATPHGNLEFLGPGFSEGLVWTLAKSSRQESTELEGNLNLRPRNERILPQLGFSQQEVSSR